MGGGGGGAGTLNYLLQQRILEISNYEMDTNSPRAVEAENPLCIISSTGVQARLRCALRRVRLVTTRYLSRHADDIWHQNVEKTWSRKVPMH